MTSNPRKSYSVIAGALFLCLCSALQIESKTGPVPITFHNAAAILLGILLGPAGGAGATGLFLLAGTAGIPLFPGWTGGFTVFKTVTGGYLAGYFIGAVVSGLCTLKLKDSDNGIKAFPAILHGCISGILCSFIPAVLACKNILEISLGQAVLHAFVPYIPAEAVKFAVIIAAAGVLRQKVYSYITGNPVSMEKDG